MKHVILSYDDDQQQTFFDLIEAETPERAQEIVASVRDYATVIDNLTAQDLREMADQIDSDEVAPATCKALADHLGQKEYELCECGRHWDDCATRDDGEEHKDR